MEVRDVIVVGAGPAGLSAALLLGRSRRSVLIFDDGRQRNAVTSEMHGFLSRDGMPPAAFLEISRDELRRYSSVRLLKGRITVIQREGAQFRVRVDGEPREYCGRRLLLATGIRDVLPDISGIAEQWGKRVFVCPYCDAWEFRDKSLAAIGAGHKAIELAQELGQWTGQLVICTQGLDDATELQASWVRRSGFPVLSSAIAAMEACANDKLGIYFADGSFAESDAAFVCAPARLRSPLIDMIGCEVDSNACITIESNGQTSVKGCYAAGDSVTKIHQVVCAAASGVGAAIGINEDLLGEDLALGSIVS